MSKAVTLSERLRSAEPPTPKPLTDRAAYEVITLFKPLLADLIHETKTEGRTLRPLRTNPHEP